MNTRKSTGLPVQIVLAIVLCLFIMSLSVVAVLNFRPLYYFDIKALNIEYWSGYDVATIRRNYDALIDYNSLFFHGPLVFPDLPMSEGGRIHFEEVKVIFDLFGYMLLITCPLSIIGIIISKVKKQYLFLKITGFLNLLLPIGLSAILAWNWDYFFVTFHELVFNNDYWLFDYTTDPVINILPDEFFMHCAIAIFVMIIVLSLLCLVIHHCIKKKSK